MKVVVALGGNALLQRSETPSAGHQLARIRAVAVPLARIAAAHSLVLTHGNGPQVGLLALQAAAYPQVPPYPLDVLDAQTAGMLGYLLEQELANLLPAGHEVACVITRVLVDLQDPAFEAPAKPIGALLTREQAAEMSAGPRAWPTGPDGGGLRRLVASPRPQRVLALPAMRWLLAQGVVVIAGGGGGIPVAPRPGGAGLQGVEAVIDKDLCSAMIAGELQADVLIIATDVEAVYLDWGLPTQHALRHATPQQLQGLSWAAGSMAPKVDAACSFARTPGRRAAIGSLDQLEGLLAGTAGTQVALASNNSAGSAT